MSDQPGSARATVAELLFDDQQLARRSRTTLAGADQAVLYLSDPSLAHTRGIVVAIADDGGEPVIDCRPRDIVALASEHRRLASMVIEPNPRFGVRLTLTGRLGFADAPSAHGLRRAALRVDEVVASCPHTWHGRYDGARRVPLALYALADPDQLSANLPRVMRHLNEVHGAQLRRLAAHAAGCPIDALAAAALADLDPTGTELRWVDSAGGHSHRIRFDPPAESLEELAAVLRACVAAAAG